MKLCYATVFDSEDIRNWSGLGVYYAKMLRESGFSDFNCLGLHKKKFPLHFIPSLKAKLNFHILGKKESPIFNTTQSKAYANIIHHKIQDGTYILSPNTVILAHLKKDLRKILYTDSTLDNLLHFYPNYCCLKMMTFKKHRN